MSRWFFLIFCFFVSSAIVPFNLQGQQTSSSSPKPNHSSRRSEKNSIDAGAITNGVYRNKNLGLSCKIPAGWVVRTEEMNARDEDAHPAEGGKDVSQSQVESGKVLLAVFSRPPEARGEEINASIVIASESAAAYPGLKDAAQYFAPITEIAKAQGFAVDEEPYEIAVGTKTLVRGDFHKDVGTRAMRQSTLAMLAHGYAVSITVIGGTEDEVEELIDGLSFVEMAKK
jgi:hypothetical protein